MGSTFQFDSPEKDYSYREFSIPKKNGKFRKIVAPSKDLLQYQRAQLPQLEGMFRLYASTAGLNSVAHGFLRGRNCVTAAEQHIGYKSTIIMDLANFFDTVNRTMFTQFSMAHVTADSRLFHEQGYCAQGFATSPILANIALLPALKQIQDYLEMTFDDFAFTIYADDIQISVNTESADELMYVIAKPIQGCLECHGFTLNPNKTRIRFAKYGYRRILGVNVGDTGIRASRRVMRKIRAARHQKNGSSLGGLTTWSQCRRPN